MTTPQPKTFANSKGAIGAKKINSNAPPMVFQRDYAHAMPLIFKNAVVLAELVFKDENNPLYMEALDTVSQFYIRMYASCREDNITGLAGWSEILIYIEDDSTNIKQKVFSTFNTFITLSLFTYMFGSKNMAIASPESIDESCYDLSMFMALLALMDDDKRKQMTTEIKKLGLISSQMDVKGLYKQGTSYLDAIKADQEQRYGSPE